MPCAWPAATWPSANTVRAFTRRCCTSDEIRARDYTLVSEVQVWKPSSDPKLRFIYCPRLRRGVPRMTRTPVKQSFKNRPVPKHEFGNERSARPDDHILGSPPAALHR